jgi:hypothetical protein
VAASPEPNPGSPASAAQRRSRSLFLLYRLHVDSQHPSAPLRAGSGAQRKTKRSGIAESLNTVTVLADEGGVAKTWIALALAAKQGESDDYCVPEADDDSEPDQPAASRHLPRPPAKIRPARPPAGTGRRLPDRPSAGVTGRGRRRQAARSHDLPRSPARICPAPRPAGSRRRGILSLKGAFGTFEFPHS